MPGILTLPPGGGIGNISRVMSIHATTIGRRLGSFLLAVLLCAVSILPAHGMRPPVAKETAYSGVFTLAEKPQTGLLCRDNPINRIDPSGHNDFSIGGLMLNISIRVGMAAQVAAPIAVKTTLAIGTIYLVTSSVIAVDEMYFGNTPGQAVYWLRDTSGNYFLIAAFLTEGVQSVALSTPYPGKASAPVKTIQVSKSLQPESAKHIEEAQAAGYPRILTVDRSTKVQNRAAALRGVPTISGLDRDEYPPAVFSEGGGGSSVRHIDPSDNRSAGALIGNQLRDVPDGSTVEIEVVQ